MQHLSLDALFNLLNEGGARVSRRDLLKAIGVAGAAGALAGSATTAAALSTVDPSAAAGLAAARQTGNTWSMAITSNPTAYPINVPAALNDILIGKCLYNTLTKYELDGASIKVVGDLATSWEANSDATEWTFKLRDGVRWHDGRPFSADDVKFSLDAYVDPANRSGFRGNLPLSGTTVVDSSTVRVTTRYPLAALPVMLGYNIAIVPKHVLEGQNLVEPQGFISRPIGTGPFKFREAQPGSFYALERNDDYFKGRPQLDGIVFKIIPDRNTQVAQLRSGDLDFTVVEPPQLSVVRGVSNLEVIGAPQVQYFFLGFNHTRDFFKDRRVRQALNHATDKQGIIDGVLNGTATLATGPTNPLMSEYYTDNVQKYDYNLDRAAELLREAGYSKGSDGVWAKDGQKLSVLLLCDRGNPVREQILTLVEQSYRQLGVDVSLDFMEWNAFLQRYRSGGDWDMVLQWWVTPPDPDMYSHYHSDGSDNRWAYNNAEVDRLLEDGRKELDRDRRIATYKRFQEIVAEDLPVIFLFYPQELQVVSTRTQNWVRMGYRDALTYMDKVSVQR